MPNRELSDNDIYYCEDCRHWTPKERRKGADKNKCKKYVIMTRNMARINNLNVCRSFKFGREYD
jgi:epoxyqueuosine reductase QueG